MKQKILACLLAVAFVLGGCAGNTAGSGSEKEPQTSRADSSTAAESQDSGDKETAQEDTTTESKSLVAYFAYSENMGDTSGMEVDAITSASLNKSTDNTEGNLQVMAQVIAEEKNADVFHIVMTAPYDPEYSSMLPRATEELRKEDWPGLQNKIENLDQYDTIYLGVPVWNAEIPPALHTFFAENDLSGKKIVLFGIHLGSGLGRMEDQVKELSGGELVDSFTITASDSNADVKEEFSEWLATINVE